MSSITAFRDYQLNQAWTWELQALTRARFISGHRTLATGFNRVRQEVLCRHRNEAGLIADLLEMRRRMNREHNTGGHLSATQSPKHQPGGLIDIEFIAQLGVLESARLFPRVIQVTGTLPQLNELMSIDWLTEEEARTLQETARMLRQRRMMASLVPGEQVDPADTRVAEEIFKRKMRATSRSLP